MKRENLNSIWIGVSNIKWGENNKNLQNNQKLCVRYSPKQEIYHIIKCSISITSDAVCDLGKYQIENFFNKSKENVKIFKFSGTQNDQNFKRSSNDKLTVCDRQNQVTKPTTEQSTIVNAYSGYQTSELSIDDDKNQQNGSSSKIQNKTFLFPFH